MGSENARTVSEFGSWLNGNEYKLLNAYAWASYDLPGGPNGEKPLQVFMSAQTISVRAFGEFMPDLPPVDRKPYTGADALVWKGYKKANNRITAARAKLEGMGIVTQLRKSGNHSTALLELNLERLKELSVEYFEKSASAFPSEADSMKNVEPEAEEAASPAGEKTRPFHEKRGTRSKETLESNRAIPQKTCPDSMKNKDIKNKDSQLFMNNGNEAISPHVGNLLADQLSNVQDEDEILPTLEEQRNQMLAALREAHPEDFLEPTGSDDLW